MSEGLTQGSTNTPEPKRRRTGHGRTYTSEKGSRNLGSMGRHLLIVPGSKLGVKNRTL